MKNIQKFILLICLLLFSISVINAQQISVEGQNLVNTGSLVLGGNMSLNIDGNFNSKGGSTIVFKGNASQKISGGVTASFNDITINNSSTGVVLQREISLYGDLTMTDGDLDILNHTLTLGLNGEIVGENSNSMIKSTSGSGSYTENADAGDGTIVRTINITTDGVTNAAGLGISITPATNWGSCQISRSHQRVVGFDGDNSIFRKISITPTNNADLSASISFTYNSSELNGYSSGSLKMYQLKNSGAKGVEWIELNSLDNGSEVAANSVDNNETELVITLASPDKALPVSLLDFKSYCDNDIVRLQWQTASEINNDYFIVEKSHDGFTYSEMARVSGNGNSNSLNNYEIIDVNDNSEIIYYRLSQVDFDGKTTTFNPISSHCGNKKDIEFTIVNPAQEQITIFSSENLNTEVEVSLIDASGRIIFLKKMYQNQNTWNFPINNLSQGIYYLRFSSDIYSKTKPISIL